MDQLGAREREVVALASRAGLTVSQIGDRLGLEEEEVHALMRQGLQVIRKELERTLRREAP